MLPAVRRSISANVGGRTLARRQCSRSSSARRVRVRLCLRSASLLLPLALALLWTPASSAATPARTSASHAAPTRAAARRENAAATHAYLLATLRLEETELANASRSSALLEETAGHIASECPGVLAGAPPIEKELSLSSLRTQTPISPRVQGEQHRQSTQREDLKLELSIALEDARSQPNREAIAALISSLTPLTFTNPAITLLVHVTVAGARAELELPTPNVCADMRAWVASGFKTLSPASKEIASHTEALLEDAFGLIAFAAQEHLESITDIFGRYENSTDRTLARRGEALGAELRSSRATTKSTLKNLEATVGLPAPKPQKKLLPSPKKPPVIARGRTIAGGKFVVRAERRSHRPDPVGCSAFITVEEPARPEGILELLTSGAGTGRCVSRSHVQAEPAVHCSSGLLIIEANLLPEARSVRLLLSNGQTVTSPAILVPARLGGPAGLYYQAVRGPSPIPVSVTELNADGEALTTLKLPAVVECTKRLMKPLPKGTVILAHGSLPLGPSFTIRGEGYRELGAAHFKLRLSRNPEASEGFLFASNGASAFENGVEGPEINGGVFNPNTQALGSEGIAFASQASAGCQPQPYAIVYGVLKAARDTVLARVAGALVPLREVAIPRRLHAGGALAYGAFSPLPTELLVRNPSGKTISTRDLGEAATSSVETCEGEAE